MYKRQRHGRLKITPLDNAVPPEATALMEQAYGMLPHLKITELLLEVDHWIGLTRHFTHLKSGAPSDDQHLLLTAILADAINLGLSKMAESCPGTTYAKLSWLQAWHIRDETYSAGLAERVNAQFRQPFAAYWGDGTTSSSDGRNFKAGGRGQFAGQVNLKYGQEPVSYTHLDVYKRQDLGWPSHQGYAVLQQCAPQGGPGRLLGHGRL